MVMRSTSSLARVVALVPLVVLAVCGAARADVVILWSSLPGGTAATVNGQPVEVQFHAQVAVFDDGRATGGIYLWVRDSERFLWHVIAGELTGERESELEVSLLLARVGEDGDPTGELDVAVVHPPADPTEPCRIYDILGTQVNARVEAETTVRFGDDKSQPDSRVQSNPQTVAAIFDEEPVDVQFHAELAVFADGTATGAIQLRVAGDESFLWRVVAAEWIGDRDSELELILWLVRVGEDGEPTGDLDFASVQAVSEGQPRTIPLWGLRARDRLMHLYAKTTIRFRD